MNIGRGTRLLHMLGVEKDISTQYTLTFLEPNEPITSLHEERIKDILAVSNSKGVSIYSSPKDMGFKNGSLFRATTGCEVCKEHRVMDIQYVLDFLERGKWNYRVFHGTFDNDQIESSLLMEVRKSGFLVFLKDGNVWDYNCFSAPLVMSSEGSADVITSSSLSPEIISFLKKTISILQDSIPTGVESLFVEWKITNTNHPNWFWVMITDICEGYPNPNAIVPNHLNILELFRSNQN